jgi:hypothetical protein
MNFKKFIINPKLKEVCLMFRNYSSVILLFILAMMITLMLIFPVVVMAQEANGEMDWGTLGVDTVIVLVLIGVVKMIRNLVLKDFPPWVPIAVSAVICLVYGVVSNIGQPIDIIVKAAFAYATAAAWLYDLSHNILKAKK